MAQRNKKFMSETMEPDQEDKPRVKTVPKKRKDQLTQQLCTGKIEKVIKWILSQDVACGSDITPCIEIDKSMVVYIHVFSNVHNNIADICIKAA